MKINSLSSKLFYVLVAAFLIITLFFAGCKSAQATAEEEATFSRDKGYATEEALMKEASAEETAMEFAEEPALDEEAANNVAVDYGDTTVAGDRKVIKTAYIEMEIDKGKFEETMFELTNLAEQSGGFVARSQSYSDSEGNITSGSITIRVPSNKYNSALDKIKEMGTIESISISGQDITQEYIDLESRLKNYKLQEEVLRDLMKQSKKVSDSIEVQRELSNVQGEIEVIKGRMRYLDDMVSFSTIDVYFHEPEPIKTGAGWGFIEALKRGVRGAVTVFNGIVMVLIAAAPLWILAGIILIIVWQAIRAKNRRRARKEQK